jgi:hypothetical protein
MNAYVLIQSAIRGGSLVQTLQGIPGVISADDVTGAYDAIAMARPDATRRLEGILGDIRKLSGVTRAIPARLMDPDAADHLVAASGAQPQDRAA